MIDKQQLLNVEVSIVKKEKNFDIKTHLIEIFKILFRLFEGREDISKEDIVSAAKRESRKRGIEDKYNNWSEIFGLEEKAVQGVKENNKEQKVETSEDVPNLQQIALLSSKPYPDSFHVGQAIGDGSCFFDSFRQGLEQQKGIKVTVKQLRNNCKEFAQNDPPRWFIDAIGNDFEEVNGEFVNRGITCDQYVNIIRKNRFWGRPDIEGRILCEKYNVNLHIFECDSGNKHIVSGPKYTRKIYSSKADEIAQRNPREVCSTQMNSAKAYELDNTIHIINKGCAHFEPLLDRKKSLAKQEQEDYELAKKLQLDEVLKYCNISKDIPERKEVEERFDELLKENVGGKIGDVVRQCAREVQQRIKCLEKPSLPSCGIEEMRLEKTFHQPTACTGKC